jgi:NRAMP (natural resistance-associated macrophage protein)-like metal ion transporter
MLQKLKKYMSSLGPGLVTGAADDDPSGIATYSQTGAQFGNQLAWMSVLTFPLMTVVQEMCARIGIVTGRGLAGNIRIRYSKKILYVCMLLLFLANTFNIGANLAAMGEVSHMLFAGIPFFVYVGFFAVFILTLQILMPYKQYAKFIKYLTFVLLAYIVQIFFVQIDWRDVLMHMALPTIVFSKDQIILICALLGTTISPYLFFWQTSQEVEEEIAQGKVTVVDRRHGDHREQIKIMRSDVFSGMFFSNLVMFFIIIMCAATLHQNGITTISSAADAANALRPFAGEYAYILFAVGIIGTGLLSIPVLAGSSAYAVAETFKFTEGLSQTFKSAKAFYLVIVFSLVVALCITFLGISPIQTLLYAAVFNGIVSPVMLYLIVDLASNKQVMGQYVNKRILIYIGFSIVGIMACASLITMYLLIFV